MHPFGFGIPPILAAFFGDLLEIMHKALFVSTPLSFVNLLIVGPSPFSMNSFSHKIYNNPVSVRKLGNTFELCYFPCYFFIPVTKIFKFPSASTSSCFPVISIVAINVIFKFL